MKRILVFFVLKIIEIMAIVFIPYLVGKFIATPLMSKLHLYPTCYWFDGLACIVIPIFGGTMLFWMCYGIISSNWELAGRIANRKKEVK